MLTRAIRTYLAVRQAAGFCLEKAGYHLRSFATYSEAKGQRYILPAGGFFDIKDGKISVSSPIARALIGKYAGDVADVHAPGGLRHYEIVDVHYI
jgi:hypothetical protein